MEEIKRKEIEGIEYVEFKNDKVLRINHQEKNFRPLSLVDIENFENGNIIKIDRNYYYLLGDNLYGIGNRKVIKADWKLSKKAKVVTPIDYIKSRSYIEYVDDKDIEEKYKEDLMYILFYKAYKKVIINNALLVLDFDKDSKYITNFKNLYDARYAFNTILLEKNIDSANMNFIGDEFVTYLDNDYCLTTSFIKIQNLNQDKININVNEFDKTLIEIQNELLKKESSSYTEKFSQELRKINDKKIEEKKQEYYNAYPFENIYINILKNDVKNQLEAGLWIIKEFIYNYGLNGKGKDSYNNKKVSGNDYSFLIINFVKAAEIFLYNKLCILEKEDFSSKKTLGDMINLINNNQNKYIKNNFSEKEKETFIKSCLDFKDIARNGNFHKHSVECFEQAEYIILNTIQFLVRIEMYIK